MTVTTKRRQAVVKALVKPEGKPRKPLHLPFDGTLSRAEQRIAAAYTPAS